jgi:hypothetical protein
MGEGQQHGSGNWYRQRIEPFIHSTNNGRVRARATKGEGTKNAPVREIKDGSSSAAEIGYFGLMRSPQRTRMGKNM